jgi:CHAT domain-containing protein/tetratricopeptide (TPR) repeat protein/ketosteroid isomerase-like protein
MITRKFVVNGMWPLWLLAFAAFHCPALALAQTSDEAVVRALTEKFGAAYEKKDMEGVMSNWDVNSPHFLVAKKHFEKLFSSTEKEATLKLNLSEIGVTGSKAFARTCVESSKSTARTAPQSLTDKISYVLRFRKDGGSWAIWEFELCLDEIIATIANAETEQERNALIAIHQPFVVSELPASLIKKARSLIKERNYARATRFSEIALGLATQLGDKAGIAAALQTGGYLGLLKGNYAQALELYQRGLKLSEELNDRANMAAMMNGLGAVHRSQGSYTLALDYLQKGLKLAEEIADKEQLTVALNNIGKVHQAQGNYDLALVYLEKGLKLAEETGNQEQTALMLGNIGNVFEWQGKYADALRYYQGTLRIGEQSGDKRLIGNALNNMGNVYEGQGNYSDAINSYRRGLEFAEELGDKDQIAIVVNNLGGVYGTLGNYALSFEYAQKCLKLAEELGDKGLILSSLNYLGMLYHAEGDYLRALEHWLGGLQLAEQLGEKSSISIVRANIGSLYKLQGNYAQALNYYENALSMAQQIGDRRTIASSLTLIGGVYLLQNKYAEALGVYQNALSLSRQVGDKTLIAASFSDIGDVYQSQHAYVQALESYQQTLKLAEEMGRKDLVAASFCHIASVYRMQGKWADAIELAGRAAELASQLNRWEIFWNARVVTGKAYIALNEPDKARRALEEAISKIELLRSRVVGGEQEHQQFFENKIAPYKAMVDHLVSQGDESAALIYAEQAKARVLLDILRSGRRSIAKAITAQEQEQEQLLHGDLMSLNSQVYRENGQPQPNLARVAELEAQLQKARLRYEAFQVNLYAAHPELKVRRGEAPPISTQEIADLLPDTKTALLEYLVTDEQIYLFVATKRNESNKTLLRLNTYTVKVEKKDLMRSVERFRTQLATRDLGFRENARKLYDLLLKPAEAQIGGNTSIIIVPDGILWELPFQALQGSMNRFLLEDFALSYVPSLTVLREMRKLKQERAGGIKNPPTLLAFGNPALLGRTTQRIEMAYRGEKLQPLPEAEKEAKILGQLYGPTNSRVYVGPNAREDRFKTEAGKFEILHLATHALLDDSTPMYSRMVLSQERSGAKEDGLLEAWEIMKLDLKSTLVVLSGCETARGRIGEGEGVIGLTWAFFVAGSPTTVVSQWKVESEGTTELMLEFHRNVKKSSQGRKTGFGAADALRIAAMKLLHSGKYHHPFYWAAFVLLGDGF